MKKENSGARFTVGLAIGIAIGIALDNLFIGMVIGAVLGLTFGSPAFNQKDKEGDSEEYNNESK